MTYTIETYKSSNGLQAEICQEKYCRSYMLDVFIPHDESIPFARTVYRGHYTSKKTARNALKRFDKTWLKVK